VIEFTTPVPRHHYSVGLIRLCLRGLLSARAGQRCMAMVLKLVAPWLPGVSDMPCANSVRMWLLRLGLYELTRAKTHADDWVWIMDHTVQLGTLKVLLIVGMRLSQWEPRRGPLRHTDLSLLDLVPMRHSNSAVVAERLTAVAQRTGVPRAIVCDGGSDLRGGINVFRQTHPQVASLYDIKHKTALLLQAQLEKDPRWAKFVAAVSQTRARLTLTALAHLLPPSLKPKARYMNLPPLVAWGQKTLRFLPQPREVPGKPLSPEVYEEKLGWLREYREALYGWSVLLTIAQTAEHCVRQEGYHATAAAQLRARLDGLGINAAAEAMAAAVVDFVAEQSFQARRNERLIGSSEVLESLIGRYKQLQGSYAHGGVTPLVLGVGGMVAAHTTKTIRAALRTVRTSDVLGWCREHLGFTLPAQRRLAFEEQKRPSKLLLKASRF
jgi:hypothetical protein